LAGATTAPSLISKAAVKRAARAAAARAAAARAPPARSTAAAKVGWWAGSRAVFQAAARREAVRGATTAA